MVNKFHQGEIIYLDFDPQTGHEQKSRRPALVVSNDIYNNYSNLLIVCPITHTERNNPYFIKIEKPKKIDGYIMCDQIRSLDVEKRNGEYIEDINSDTLEEVLDLLKLIL